MRKVISAHPVSLLHSIYNGRKRQTTTCTLHTRGTTSPWHQFGRDSPDCLSSSSLQEGDKSQQRLPFVSSSSGQALQDKYRIMQKSEAAGEAAERSSLSTAPAFTMAHMGRRHKGTGQKGTRGMRLAARAAHHASPAAGPLNQFRPETALWARLLRNHSPHSFGF